MTAAFASLARRWGPRSSLCLFLLLLAAVPGCKRDGLSDYQREQNKREEDLNSLRDNGAKITKKNYPRYGYAYIVDLNGAQVTDSTFRTLKDLKRVSELDLSKSSLTDDQMDKLNEVARWLVKLDLSNTAVSDAGLSKLTNLNVCFDLNLVGTQVTPAGVERLRQQRLANPQTRVSNTKIRLK